MEFSSFDSSGTALTISLELSIRMYWPHQRIVLPLPAGNQSEKLANVSAVALESAMLTLPMQPKKTTGTIFPCLEIVGP